MRILVASGLSVLLLLTGCKAQSAQMPEVIEETCDSTPVPVDLDRSVRSLDEASWVLFDREDAAPNPNGCRYERWTFSRSFEVRIETVVEGNVTETETGAWDATDAELVTEIGGVRRSYRYTLEDPAGTGTRLHLAADDTFEEWFLRPQAAR